MDFSKEHKAYLKRKHQGGVGNQKGNSYESIYATKEIVRLFASGEDIATTFVGTQMEGLVSVAKLELSLKDRVPSSLFELVTILN